MSEHEHEAREELERARQRMHRISDVQQTHALKLGEHAVLIRSLQHAMDSLRMTAVTKDQLEHAVTLITTQHTHSAESITSQIKAIQDKVDPIQKGISRLAWLIVTMVVVALVGLVLSQRVVAP